MLFYLHAVVDVVDHREALSVLHALPVRRGPLPRTNHPILALGGRYGEVLPGIGLGGNGVSFWSGRGGLILKNKTRIDCLQGHRTPSKNLTSHLCSRCRKSSGAYVTLPLEFDMETRPASILWLLTSAHRFPVETDVIFVPGPPGYTALPAGLWP